MPLITHAGSPWVSWRVRQGLGNINRVLFTEALVAASRGGASTGARHSIPTYHPVGQERPWDSGGCPFDSAHRLVRDGLVVLERGQEPELVGRHTGHVALVLLEDGNHIELDLVTGRDATVDGE